VQHALRAYTPAEQKAVRAAAKAFRVNKAFDTEEALMSLGVGEALVSFLDEEGIPSVVERAFILPPQSKMGMADENHVKSVILTDEFELKYRESVDRESAYEVLNATAMAAEAAEEERQAAIEAEKAKKAEEKEAAELARLEAQKKREEQQAALAEARLEAQKKREEERAAAAAARAEAAAKREAEREEAARLRAEIAAKKEKERQEELARKEKERKNKVLTSIATSGARTFTTTIARSFARGLLGSIKK
jgi:hypothetical protein